MEKIAMKMAGEITLSDQPGSTMKKWREIFDVTQAELGGHLKISASTISDYEGNRRKSPGIAVVHRFVNALIDIDKAKGGRIAKRFIEAEAESKFFDTGEFTHTVRADEFAKMIDAQVLSCADLLETKKVHGYTLLNSLKIITEMPSSEFHKLYGSSPERAFIFSEVSTGRSPMVVVRVTQMKPSVIVLHNLKKVDKLAVKLSEVERIPILITDLSLAKLKARLDKI